MKRIIVISSLCSLMAVSAYASGGLFNIPPEDPPPPKVPEECTVRPGAEKTWACCMALCRTTYSDQDDLEQCKQKCDEPPSKS